LVVSLKCQDPDALNTFAGDLGELTSFLDLEDRHYVRVQQDIYCTLAVSNLLLDCTDMTNVTPIGSKLLPERWEWNLFYNIIALLHGLYCILLKDFNRASETHNMADNLLRKSESVLVDPCGPALSLVVLLSIQEIPADLDPPVLIVRKCFEIHRQCDYRPGISLRSAPFSQIFN
jgi:hypothetical protein